MKSLFNNLSMKVIALILGFLLWFHVATEKPYNYQLSLPVSDIQLDEEYTLKQDPPDSIQAVVSASGKNLLRSRWRDEGVRISATQLRPGRHDLSLSTANTFLVGGGNVMSLEEVVSPATVRLEVDTKAEAVVPVTVDLITMPDEGYAVKAVSDPDPPEVTLVGPRSRLSSFRTVLTEQRELSGLRNDLQLTVGLVKPAGYNITLQPDSVTVTVEVVPVQTRVFENVPIVVFNVPPGQFMVARPDTLSVILTGPPAEIGGLSATALVATVDYAGTDDEGRTAVTIDCPSIFRVKSASVDSVYIVTQ